MMNEFFRTVIMTILPYSINGVGGWAFAATDSSYDQLHSTKKKIVDHLNRSVEITDNPCRIISLDPISTQIIYLLNAQDKLIAFDYMSRSSKWARKVDPDWSKRQVLTYGKTLPNLEVVASLKADLIIQGAFFREYVFQLEKVGPCIAFDFHSRPAVDAVELIGNAIGKEKRAQDRYRKTTGTRLKCHIPPYCSNDPENIYSEIWQMPNIEKFPDAVASDGLDDLFRRKFIETLVKKGYFKNAWNSSINKSFEKAGFEDPNGWYTVYAVTPFILLIDNKKLDGIPVPRRWSDLLEQHYRNKIIFCGMEGHPVHVPLLYFFKEHGEEGIRRLAANTKALLHSAEIAKTAGSSNPSGAPVYVQSLFFAQCCPRNDMTTIVWPEDGACTSPLYLLVKGSRMKELSILTEYINGSELGEKLVQSGFLSLNPNVDNRLPKHAFFKWLGWDYIISHDLVQIREQVKRIFVSELEKNAKKEML